MRKAVEDRLEKKNSDRNLMEKKFQILITIQVNRAVVVSMYEVAFSMSVWAWPMPFFPWAQWVI